MAVRNAIATSILGAARSFGNALGCELKIEESQHSLHTSMVVPETDTMAWDPDHFKAGNYYIRGHANPVKHAVRDPEDPHGQKAVAVPDAVNAETESEVELVPSRRYQEYQDQHVISQMAQPEQHYTTMFYLLLGILGLVMITLVVMVVGVLPALGVF